MLIRQKNVKTLNGLMNQMSADPFGLCTIHGPLTGGSAAGTEKLTRCRPVSSQKGFSHGNDSEPW